METPIGRKKILFVVEAMGGGVFTYIVDLANALAERFDVYVAYSVRIQTPVDFREYFDARIHLIQVENFCRKISPVKDCKALLEVKKIAEEVKPDIIHLHSSKAGVIGRVAFAHGSVPLFYTPHGYSFLMKNYKPLKRWMFKTVEALLAKGRCKTVSCSAGEHEETWKLTKNAAYVNNAVNVKKLQESLDKVRPVDHPFTVFTLGRICYQKNPKLFNEIAMAMPETKFLWIGDGEMRECLTSPNIEVTGWTSREEALERAVNVDMFILTSLWEGLPISLLEAMYMRKCCAVSDVSGCHDVIHNGENGYVCQTVPEYVHAIRERKSAYADQAYADVINKYETGIQAGQYAEIYGFGDDYGLKKR